MDCTQSVVDIFMTEEATELDQFKGYVYSVEIAYHPTSDAALNHPKAAYIDDTLDEGYHAAIVANWPTLWIMQTSEEPNIDLNIGDTVRCGGHSGDSEHLVIVDKVRVNSLRNGVSFKGKTTSPDVHFVHGNGEYLTVEGAANQNHDTSTDLLKTIEPVSVTFPLYAYKVNLRIDLTTPALSETESSDWRFLNTGNDVPYDVFVHRYQVPTGDSLTSEAAADKNHRGSTRLYKVITERRPLKMDFTALQKGIKWIKLVGYSVFDKPQVGFDVGHIHRHQDYLTLRIKGIDGNVISNNKAVEGAFCVLHGGQHEHRATGSTEFQHHDMQGIAQLGFSCPSQVRQLQFEILDHQGEPAKFGRIHLWLKACVLHG